MKIQSIIINEWRNLLRGNIAKALLGVLLVLAVFAVWQSYQLFAASDRSREAAQQHMRSRFLEQGEVNPHSAAHYGHFVYKPVSTLSVFDQGVNPFTGLSLRLEGHKQNELMFSAANRSSSLIRFGQLDLGLILQLLLPLLIIFVCHDAISRLREQGTLPLMLTQGATLRKLMWGKFLAYWLLWLSFLVVSILVLWVFSATSADADSVLRLLLLFLLYGLFYAMVTAGSIYISALSRTSSAALLPLLFIWLICFILLPKGLANLSEQIHPLTTRLVLDQRIKEDNKNGINGHDPRNERTKKFQDSLLKVHRVDSAAQLPVNLDGLTMQADEEYHNKVYDRHLGNVQQRITSQNRMIAWSSLINPFSGIQSMSMSLAGTDTYHHFHFSERAEGHRRELIRELNLEQAYGGSKTGDWQWKVKADYWQKIRDFHYRSPGVAWAIRHNVPELLSLLLWCAGLFLLINLTANRIKIAR
ncbi:ABC transporter permease [Pedobacter deserti]|uniref:ABC transporter permease n=1 Tax=Pedobacter deserti TaxID=2817382 RepID=UPI002109CA2B|nr:DUF3526 domain-containing protein [Pedobacter sp. SYSU D00382]